MAHPLVVALFPSVAAAAAATRALHEAGITREQISIVARNHDEQGVLADQMDATPGTDIEDSRLAGRLGELSGQVLAAIALVLPGIGPIVTAGPLSAGLGEAAGHVAGGVASALTSAGIPAERSAALQRAVEGGAVLIGVHATAATAATVRGALERGGATSVDVANWPTQ
jgi:hypothetical protein